MSDIEPTCPENYKLDKDSCMCVPKTIPKTIKRKRCPKGYRINKTTKLCYNIKTGKILSIPKKPSTEPSSLVSSIPDLSPIDEVPLINEMAVTDVQVVNDVSKKKQTLTQKQTQKKRTRCPKGSRKNKKTGLCEDIKTGKVVDDVHHSPDVIIVDSSSLDADQISMREAVQTIVNKPKTIQIRQAIESQPTLATVRQADRLLSDELRREIIKTKSYSPTINKLLISLRRGDYSSIFGCGAERDIQQVSNDINNIQVRVGTNPDGSQICVGAKTIQGVNAMLNNLKLIEQINCDNIIAPMQIQSNCWFNSFFMQFFISDKGRKFSRALRQLMIQGHSLNGRPIVPEKLRDSFLLLNTAIEACYNYDGSSKDIALALNTNSIIRGIASSIPKSFIERKMITDVNKPGNPTSYYKSLVNYLTNTTESELPVFYSIVFKSEFERVIMNGRISFFFPHIIFISTFSGPMRKNDYLYSKDPTVQIPTKFTLRSSATPGDIATYELDSATVRDTKNKHFCSTLVCNKKEYGFDGASFSRMSQLGWKKMINVNRDWTFRGSTWVEPSGIVTDKPIYWNFKKSYVTYFYYRTK